MRRVHARWAAHASSTCVLLHEHLQVDVAHSPPPMFINACGFTPMEPPPPAWSCCWCCWYCCIIWALRAPAPPPAPAAAIPPMAMFAPWYLAASICWNCCCWVAFMLPMPFMACMPFIIAGFIWPWACCCCCCCCWSAASMAGLWPCWPVWVFIVGRRRRLVRRRVGGCLRQRGSPTPCGQRDGGGRGPRRRTGVCQGSRR
ncbi:hypothetical protein PHLGIDRAFT_145019 [Phlebiopsis gigantea 11061_1 CR5-6]|uniref:Uncharacterized protein n=1 Tax=Phlebiopsis gigantea (strain 11061_1 CR5-6) TaxID=745531 RepID=A0A0C3S5I1_PHLG1|nr:hypothetical protein PHLGIDRAFT_145019 [Phlebiopsis gigantea 11061_1 CR5-6]